ncbi:MAG: signal peptidase I [Eubacteriales bacterium]|nr:signal peptidase I [Clostridiales bacterium]MDY5835676.1 signal peptidase I [Eubacteriales bacterium]
MAGRYKRRSQGPQAFRDKRQEQEAVRSAGEAVLAEEAIRQELAAMTAKRQARHRKSDLESSKLLQDLNQMPLHERKQALQEELRRERFQDRYRKALRSTFFSLVVVAAIAVLVATLWLPVLQVYGNSMNPTLEDGEVLISLHNGQYHVGDIIAFYYNNKVLIKRVIGNPGDWIDIDQDGNVKVNQKELDEPYVQDKALGDCDISLPFQVPEGRIFVMGDHRSTSVDSRKEAVGCIADEQIVGRLIYRIWPLRDMGPLK